MYNMSKQLPNYACIRHEANCVNDEVFMVRNDFSIKDIAKEANVSSATVSRVFAGNSYVSAQTRELVLQIAQAHGYEPRTYQKRHHDQKNGQTVGIVVADLHNPFFLNMISCIENALSSKGIECVICNSNESSQKEIRILNMLKKQVDGIIISPISENAEYNIEFMKELNAAGTPIVLIDRDLKGVGLDGVFQDNYNISVECVEALIRAGHKNIATIAGPISSKPGIERLNGYMDALSTHGIPVKKEYIAYGDFKAESGYSLASEMIDHHPEVTAIYCCNNLMTFGAIQAIYAKGLLIPDDIAIISSDSVHTIDIAHGVAISSISQPVEQMGEEAATMIIEKLSVRRKQAKAIRRITYEGHLKLCGSELYPKNRK